MKVWLTYTETPPWVEVRSSSDLKGEILLFINTAQAPTVYQLLFEVLGAEQWKKLTKTPAKLSLYSTGDAA